MRDLFKKKIIIIFCSYSRPLLKAHTVHFVTWPTQNKGASSSLRFQITCHFQCNSVAGSRHSNTAKWQTVRLPVGFAFSRSLKSLASGRGWERILANPEWQWWPKQTIDTRMACHFLLWLLKAVAEKSSNHVCSSAHGDTKRGPHTLRCSHKVLIPARTKTLL